MMKAATMTTAMAISGEAKESIAERLSEVHGLYFPRVVQAAAAASQSQRKALLLDLLARDAAVFLERYGTQLTSEELKSFDALDTDYEVNWHLKHIRSIMTPTQDDLRLRSTTVKNRRRAFMAKLIYDGQYFSEDAMREREPYLHYEYVGKFQDITGRRMARPGERWSDTLIRRSEEAIIIAKIREEQQRLGVAERDWVGYERQQEKEMEEIEEEEEEMEEMEEEEMEEMEEEEMEEMKEEEEEKVGQECDAKENGGAATEPDQSPDVAEVSPSHSTAGNVHPPLDSQPIEIEIPTAEELQERMEQFTIVMQDKFLSGDDSEHVDYTKIDQDVSLDDHWSKEANLDAEEKYFDKD